METLGNMLKCIFIEKMEMRDYRVFAADNRNYGDGILSGEEVPAFLSKIMM